MRVKSFILGMVALLATAASAYSPVPPPQILARVSWHPGFMIWDDNEPMVTQTVLSVNHDGKVYAAETVVLRGVTSVVQKQPLLYSQSDIQMFAKSIAQLKKNRPLVEVGEENPSDGPTRKYSVTIDGDEVLLYEITGGGKRNLARKGRSQLEIDVIQVLEDLVRAYYQTKPAR